MGHLGERCHGGKFIFLAYGDSFWAALFFHGLKMSGRRRKRWLFRRVGQLSAGFASSERRFA
jgi:hypothetical protein